MKNYFLETVFFAPFAFGTTKIEKFGQKKIVEKKEESKKEFVNYFENECRSPFSFLRRKDFGMNKNFKSFLAISHD